MRPVAAEQESTHAPTTLRSVTSTIVPWHRSPTSSTVCTSSSSTTSQTKTVAPRAPKAPAIARPLTGHGSVALAPSALVGAALLALSDLVAQYALPNVSMPVGVVTGAFGAVFLLWLLATSKGRAL